jgi:chromosome segregation ATPase
MKMAKLRVDVPESMIEQIAGDQIKELKKEVGRLERRIKKLEELEQKKDAINDTFKKMVETVEYLNDVVGYIADKLDVDYVVHKYYDYD